MPTLLLDIDTILSNLYQNRFDGLLQAFQMIKERNLYVSVYNGVDYYHYIRNYKCLRELPYSPLPHPMLDYDFLLRRLVEHDRFDILEAMDDFDEGKGFVDWGFVLDFELRRHPDILSGAETEWSVFAWKHITKRRGYNLSKKLVSNPRFFVYIHNTIHSIFNNHEYYNTLSMVLERCFASTEYAKVITTQWMQYKPARELYKALRDKSSKVVNCDIETRYIDALLYEKEVECQRVLLDTFLPSSILDVSRYIVSTYL